VEEFRLLIETTPYAFVSWLNDELLSFHAIPIIIGNVNEGSNLVKRLEFGTPEIEEPIKKFEHYRIRVTGTVQVTGPDVKVGGMTMWIPRIATDRLDPVISIKIRDLGCNRVEILGECEFSKASGYAFMLAGKIAETFPLLKPPEFHGYTIEKLDREHHFKFFDRDKKNPLLEMQRFKTHIERQAYKDVFVNDKPQENIARALLQAYLPERGYREVPVRGGQSDLLLFTREGRFLYEAKIWHGRSYFQQGMREIEEYILGEDDDQNLLGIFYVIFDPTKTNRARNYKGDDFPLYNVFWG
jgi:hypothetical protein